MRPEVKAFAEAMEARLKENDYKGGWETEPDIDLLQNLQRNVAQLGYAAAVGAWTMTSAVDIANYAMMVADVNSDLDCLPEDDEKPVLTLEQLQDELERWSKHNFGEVPYWQPLMGLMEEVGELSHSLLKQEQGIRGDSAEHEEKAMDAIGDIDIYLADLCNKRGWDRQTILERTWAKVKARDWKKDPEKGGTTGSVVCTPPVKQWT